MHRKVSFLGVFALALLSFVRQTSAESSLSDSYDTLFFLLTLVSAFVLLLVVALWGYFMYQFREDNEEVERTPISHETSRKLELGWTAVAIFIVIVLMFASYPTLFGETNQAELSQDGEKVVVIGTNSWSWVYILEDGTQITPQKVGDDQVTNITLQTNKLYTFEFVSNAQFIHSYYVDALNIKMDVIPGQNATYTFEITEANEYPVLCAEFCGIAHSNMKGYIIAEAGA